MEEQATPDAYNAADRPALRHRVDGLAAGAEKDGGLLGGHQDRRL